MNGVPVLGGRREAREEALSFLYEIELTKLSVPDALDAREVPLEDYAVVIVDGVGVNLELLDELIEEHLYGWRIQRMPIIDRVIARIAVWELCNCGDVPTGAILSEAVELATQYCAEESPRFLNGVLSSVAVAQRPRG